VLIGKPMSVELIRAFTRVRESLPLNLPYSTKI